MFFAKLFFIVGASKNIEESMKMVAIVECPLGKLKSVSKRRLLTGLILSVTVFIISGKAVPAIAAIVRIQKDCFLFFNNKNIPKTRNTRIDSGMLHTFVTESIRESRVGD